MHKLQASSYKGKTPNKFFPFHCKFWIYDNSNASSPFMLEEKRPLNFILQLSCYSDLSVFFLFLISLPVFFLLLVSTCKIIDRCRMHIETRKHGQNYVTVMSYFPMIFHVSLSLWCHIHFSCSCSCSYFIIQSL